MSRDDAVLLDLLIAAQRAIAFSTGVTQDDLGSDLKTQSAGAGLAAWVSALDSEDRY